MMKVCHITSAHAYTSPRIFLKECQTLAGVYEEVYLIAPNAPNKQINNVKIRGVKSNSKNRLSRMTKTVWAVYKKSLLIDADIYHFHDPELLFVGALLKRKGKKVVYDIHEDVPIQILSKEWIPLLLRKRISSVYRIIENKLAKKFDGLVTATPFISKRFEKLNSHTININNYPFEEEIYNEVKSTYSKKRNVCYLGGINYIRGIKEMVESLNYTDARLTLAGHFMDHTQKDEIVQLEGWKYVDELGFVDRTEVQKILQESQAGLVVLHPIRNYIDSLPVKMFEYMAGGIPVIASNFSLWKDIINHEKCGICVDPMKPKEIGEAIQWVLDNPKEAQAMGERGRKAVREKYNWTIEGEKLLQLYKNL